MLCFQTTRAFNFFFSAGVMCFYTSCLKLIILKIFTSLSFAAPMVIIGKYRCVFGPHLPSFIVCCHRPFLCLFGHTNRLFAMLAETRKNSTPFHAEVS